MLTSETDSPVTPLLICVGNIGDDSCNLGDNCYQTTGKLNMNKCMH